MQRLGSPTFAAGCRERQRNAGVYPHSFLSSLPWSDKTCPTHSHLKEQLSFYSCGFTTLIPSTATCCRWRVVGFVGYFPDMCYCLVTLETMQCNYDQQSVFVMYDILSTCFHVHAVLTLCSFNSVCFIKPNITHETFAKSVGLWQEAGPPGR